MTLDGTLLRHLVGTRAAVAIVGTSVQRTTASAGTPLSDVGHPFLSFGADGLALVNKDAAVTGIHTVESCGQ